MSAIDITINALVCAVLLYGAVWDAKQRIIPNIVPAILGLLGIATLFIPGNSIWQIPLSVRIAGFAIPTATMLILHLLKKPVGGGDFKLCAALGFLLGLTQFALAYSIGGVLALVWAGIKKQKSVPLAVFLAMGVGICLWM